MERNMRFLRRSDIIAEEGDDLPAGRQVEDSD